MSDREQLLTAFYAEMRRAARCKQAWVMNLDCYRQMRAAAVTEQQEAERAAIHAAPWIPLAPVFPMSCPACKVGPFASHQELADHVIAMSDPMNREPSADDRLLGLPIVVRDDGGEPHIEWLLPEEISR